MALAKVPQDHDTVEVAGIIFDVRCVTRAEAARFQKMENGPADALEMAVISAATDTPLDEVRPWYETTPTWAVEELLRHINRISRTDTPPGEAQKSG